MSIENTPGSHPPEDDTSFDEDFGDPGIAETSPDVKLLERIERLDVEYRARLAELFTHCLNGLSMEELDFIRNDEEFRNKTAHALQALGIDVAKFDMGDYFKTPYVARDPAVAWLAQDLNARAQQVDEVFQAKAAEIALATGALHIPGTVKDVNRLSEKIEVDYYEYLGW